MPFSIHEPGTGSWNVRIGSKGPHLSMVLALMSFSPTIAGADSKASVRPDPAAIAAAEDANVEVDRSHSGLMVSLSAGPGVQAGVGIEKSTGTGAVGSLRLGRAATPNTLLLIEIATTLYRHQEVNPIDGTTQSSVHTSTIGCVGAQHWLRTSAWVRAGIGVAGFSRQGSVSGTKTRAFDGAGLVAGAGVDLLRAPWAALSLEVLATSAVYADGIVVGGGLALGGSLD